MYLKRFMLFLFLLILFSGVVNSEEEKKTSSKIEKLTVELIMRNPKWIGSSPGNPYWSEDSKNIYFMWNPKGADSDSLYVIPRNGGTPRKVTFEERQKLPGRFGNYNENRTKKVFVRDGDIYILDLKKNMEFRVTQTNENESNPQFSKDEQKIIFSKANNLFMWFIRDGRIVQLTDFRKGAEKKDRPKYQSDQENHLSLAPVR